jgi:hypothetical protein
VNEEAMAYRGVVVPKEEVYFQSGGLELALN